MSSISKPLTAEQLLELKKHLEQILNERKMAAHATISADLTITRSSDKKGFAES